jgi:hypothetical protein
LRDILLESLLQEGYHGLVSLKAVRKELDRILNEVESALKKVEMREVAQPKPFRDPQGNVYFRLDDFWKESEVYIKADDLKRLRPDRDTLVPVLEKTGQQFRMFQTYALRRLDELHVSNKDKKATIATEKTEEEIVEEQSASVEVTERWNRELEALDKRCQRDIQLLESRRAADNASVKRHLFVPHTEAQHIRESLDEALKDITQAQLEIARARHRYESAEANR